jgi:hypothetical protein
MPKQMVIDGETIFIGDGNNYSITAFSKEPAYLTDFSQQYGDYPSGMFAVDGNIIYSPLINYEEKMAILDKSSLLAGEGAGGLFDPPESNPVQVELWDWPAPFNGIDYQLLAPPGVLLREMKYNVRIMSLTGKLFDVAGYDQPYRKNVKMKLLLRGEA